MVSQHDAPLTKAEGNDTHSETVAWRLSNQTLFGGAGGERLVILCKTGVRKRCPIHELDLQMSYVLWERKGNVQ